MKYGKKWQPYDYEYGYDKQEYDIKLRCGKIIENTYPNAGTFISFVVGHVCYEASEVSEIRLSENPILGINN